MPTVAVPHLKLERIQLSNGLRFVLNPDRSAPVVGITACYDVGFRSEPEGRTGFAHLFEHLMFEGSATLDKGEADKLIEGNGGVGNGSTHPDYTNYLAVLPSNALELGLFLEADRMRGARLTEENLANQIDVVKEEIRLNVLNRPYGGFPWIDLPPVMFRTFNNSHNGYGSFKDLSSATVEDAADFFARFYCPANAVVAVAGDLDVDRTIAMIERHFGDLKPRPAPRRPDFSEPIPRQERRRRQRDALAPLAAAAVGYRVPDPIAQLPEYAAVVVLGEVLAGGEASRLYQRLVRDDRLVAHIGGAFGAFGETFEQRDPLMFQLTAYLSPGSTVDGVLAAVDEEVGSVTEGVESAEVERAVTSLVSGHLQGLDDRMQRSINLSVWEQQRQQPELANELPLVLADVTPKAVAEAAARWLRPTSRAVLEVEPGAAA